MPYVERGPLRGNYLPDYDGGSTVNLMASLIRGAGGRSPHRELEGLPAVAVARHPSIVYVVVDGLGHAQLERHRQAGQGQRFFARHEVRAISTVFPATTAAAVTTFDTGTSPAEHAILSWFLHLPDLGSTTAVLRTTTRTGTPLVPNDFDVRRYYDVPSYVESIAAARGLLSYGDIPFVRFAAVGTQWSERHAYTDLAGLVSATVAFASVSGRRFAYVYWPRYDGLCHELGCGHASVDAHFEDIDRALGELAEALRGTGTLLCVTADHGLVDVERERCIELADVPGLMSCLAVAPIGDQRQQSCFVRPHKLEAFHAIVRDALSSACVCVPGHALLAAGAFGPGRHHPALEQRLGDYVLLCRDDHALVHTPTGMTPIYMRGSHGGMSDHEVRIPLVVADCR